MLIELDDGPDEDTFYSLFDGCLGKGYCVQVNGVDYAVHEITTTGFYLKPWDSETGKGVGEVIRLEWAQIERVKIY
jgi:hypothetical protein